MDAFRAKRIADSFSDMTTFHVENRTRGLLISFMGNRAYFVREACFWPFVFKVALAGHEESAVAEIESEFIT
ncbi:MAG: hypothetical protein KAJ73_08620 [Zetaproteobacteria bacterium]|nr:hypothetical protein [Zetaproteobacteria bacterium]